jgi:fumarylacetoacetate (FAA) hydrolase
MQASLLNGPVAVTPDEIDEAWRDARIDLALEVKFNGELFGRANGYAMEFGFDDLAMHASYSRDLVAGTVIGSGTVSNPEWREVGSSCISERRMIEVLDHGAPQTGFMQFGDRVRMEARTRDGEPVFGAIDQIVTRPQ